jgi:transcriptional regulator with XRE-family HTH domain
MPPIDSATFGRRLRKIREYRGLTLAELAIAINKSPATVSCWESGLLAIADGDITKCARILRCRRFDLFAALGAPLPLCPCCKRVKRQLQRRIRARRGDVEAV